MENTRIGKGSQGYGYKYTDLAQIHLYLEENKMKYYQYVERIDGDDYIMTVPNIDGKEENPRRGVKIVDAVLSGIKNPAQEQGSATTYARRYSLLMAFGLATEDDDAQKFTQKNIKDKKKEFTHAPISFDRLRDIKELIKGTKANEEEFFKHFKIESYSDINKSNVDNIEDKLWEKKTKMSSKVDIDSLNKIIGGTENE